MKSHSFDLKNPVRSFRCTSAQTVMAAPAQTWSLICGFFYIIILHYLFYIRGVGTIDGWGEGPARFLWLGCSAIILFRNLLLGRVVTSVTRVTRQCHGCRTACGNLVACVCLFLFNHGRLDLPGISLFLHGETQVFQITNCLVMLLGVCCMHSLFSSISVLIHQGLSLLLAMLERLFESQRSCRLQACQSLFLCVKHILPWRQHPQKAENNSYRHFWSRHDASLVHSQCFWEVPLWGKLLSKTLATEIWELESENKVKVSKKT